MRIWVIYSNEIGVYKLQNILSDLLNIIWSESKNTAKWRDTNKKNDSRHNTYCIIRACVTPLLLFFPPFTVWRPREA